MWLEIFIRGLIVGFAASIPLGPIGVLCIQRTLSKSHKAGFISGLGAASADTIFASIAFFSLSIVMSFIQDHMNVIKVIGGICILAVGTKIFITNPIVQIRRNRAGVTNSWQDYITVFFFTLANPAFILIFVFLFTAFGISAEPSAADSHHLWRGIIMVIGVFCGSATWWFSITFGVNLIRNKFRPRHLLWINRVTGAIIMALGIITILLIFKNTPIDGMLPE